MSNDGNVKFYNLHPQFDEFEADVLKGLRLQQKQLSPKYFYDERGSKLFDQICWVPEYYPTRTEIDILRTNGADIADQVGADSTLLEFGSGSSVKARFLLDAVRPVAYMALDISKERLETSAALISRNFPRIEVHAICVDYSKSWLLPKRLDKGRRIVFFPGSSIGNFDPDAATILLKRIHELILPDGGLLIGVDLKKNTAILEAAYNDSKGITEAFNKNLLVRLNRELNADFNLAQFKHCAFYNEIPGRIEMHLKSDQNQVVQVAGERFGFRQGETIHTENSYKYSIAEFQRLAAGAGFCRMAVWRDPANLFSLQYFEVY